MTLMACSASVKSENDSLLELAGDEFAQTDAVPADSAEVASIAEPAAENKPEAQDLALPEDSSTPQNNLAQQEPEVRAAPVMAAMSESKPARVGKASHVATTGKFAEYTFQASDTLMKIAFDTYGDVYQWKRIYNDNKEKIADPNNVPPGTVLRLDSPVMAFSQERNGEAYVIQEGDTLGKISSNVYGTPVKWRQIWENNKQLIKDPNRIYAGFTLYYTMTPEEREQAEQLKRGGLGNNSLAKTPAAETGRTPASNAAASPAQPAAAAPAAGPAAPAGQ